MGKLNRLRLRFEFLKLQHLSMSSFLRALLLVIAGPIVFFGSQRNPVVGRLAPVTGFPRLPALIAKDLANRGCRIPQVKGGPQSRNVVQGQFEKPNQRDWAVLCLQGNTSMILVYENGSAKNLVQLAPMDETIIPYKNGYYRILRVVGSKFIQSHYDPSASDLDTLPDILDHDGIDDGIVEKASIVHYFYNGKWLRLPGSD